MVAIKIDPVTLGDILSLISMLLTLFISVVSALIAKSLRQHESREKEEDSEPEVFANYQVVQNNDGMFIELSLINSHAMNAAIEINAESLLLLHFDQKKEETKCISSKKVLLPNSIDKVICRSMYCDLDSFSANFGGDKFNNGQNAVDYDAACSYFENLGFLDYKGKKSIGIIHTKFEYTYPKKKGHKIIRKYSEPVYMGLDNRKRPCLRFE